MRSNILFGESDCSRVVVEAARDLKFADCVFSSSSDMALGHWSNVELLECHYIFLPLVLIMASPLPRLHEMRHPCAC
jgi:hypothetical protein